MLKLLDCGLVYSMCDAVWSLGRGLDQRQKDQQQQQQQQQQGRRCGAVETEGDRNEARAKEVWVVLIYASHFCPHAAASFVCRCACVRMYI